MQIGHSFKEGKPLNSAQLLRVELFDKIEELKDETQARHSLEQENQSLRASLKALQLQRDSERKKLSQLESRILMDGYANRKVHNQNVELRRKMDSLREESRKSFEDLKARNIALEEKMIEQEEEFVRKLSQIRKDSLNSAQIREREEKQACLLSELKSAQATLERSNESAAQLEKTLQLQIKRTTELEAELIRVREECEYFQQSSSKSVHEVRRLSSALMQMQFQKRTVEEKQQKQLVVREQLQRKNREQADVIEQLTRELAEVKIQFKNLSESLPEKKQTIARLEQFLQQTKRSLQQMQEERDQAVGKSRINEEYKLGFDKNYQELQAEFWKVQSQAAQLQKAKSDLNDCLQSLRLQFEIAKSKLEVAESYKRQTQLQVGKLQQELARSDKELSERGKVEQELRQVIRKKDAGAAQQAKEAQYLKNEAEKSLALAKCQIAQLHQQKKKASSQLSDLNETRMRITLVENELRVMAREFERSERELEKSRGQAKQAKDELRRLKMVSDQRGRKIAKNRQKLEVVLDELQAMKSEQGLVRGELGQIQSFNTFQFCDKFFSRLCSFILKQELRGEEDCEKRISKAIREIKKEYQAEIDRVRKDHVAAIQELLEARACLEEEVMFYVRENRQLNAEFEQKSREGLRLAASAGHLLDQLRPRSKIVPH